MLGRTFAGYRLDEQIGEGAFGKVYRAIHIDMDRVAAVKVAREARFGQMLVSEGKLLAKLSHPNIVGILHMDAQGDPPFVVMEYVDGESLASRLQRGPLSARQAIKLALPLLEALGAAHELGILHRDIKPSNILIAADGTPKLADFGLGRVVAEESLWHSRHDPVPLDAAISMRLSQVSQPGSEGADIIGTIAYMSPEQMDGQSIDARSDLYSFGVVLYEAVTGKLPVGRFKLPGELFPGVPEKLDALLDALLAPEPADRPESAAATRELLRSAAEPSVTTSPVVPEKSEEGSQPAASPESGEARWADAEAYCARMRLGGRPDAEIADGLRRAGWRQEQIAQLLGLASLPEKPKAGDPTAEPTDRSSAPKRDAMRHILPVSGDVVMSEPAVTQASWPRDTSPASAPFARERQDVNLATLAGPNQTARQAPGTTPRLSFRTAWALVPVNAILGAAALGLPRLLVARMHWAGPISYSMDDAFGGRPFESTDANIASIAGVSALVIALLFAGYLWSELVEHYLPTGEDAADNYTSFWRSLLIISCFMIPALWLVSWVLGAITGMFCYHVLWFVDALFGAHRWPAAPHILLAMWGGVFGISIALSAIARGRGLRSGRAIVWIPLLLSGGLAFLRASQTLSEMGLTWWTFLSHS